MYSIFPFSLFIACLLSLALLYFIAALLTNIIKDLLMVSLNFDVP